MMNIYKKSLQVNKSASPQVESRKSKVEKSCEMRDASLKLKQKTEDREQKAKKSTKFTI